MRSNNLNKQSSNKNEHLVLNFFNSITSMKYSRLSLEIHFSVPEASLVIETKIIALNNK